jgi:hypothetical protein
MQYAVPLFDVQGILLPILHMKHAVKDLELRVLLE